MFCSHPTSKTNTFQEILETTWTDFEPMVIKSSFEKPTQANPIDWKGLKSRAAKISLCALAILLGLALLGCGSTLFYLTYLLFLEKASLLSLSGVGFVALTCTISGVWYTKFAFSEFFANTYKKDYQRLPRRELQASISLWDFSSNTATKDSNLDDFNLLPAFTAPSSTSCSSELNPDAIYEYWESTNAKDRL